MQESEAQDIELGRSGARSGLSPAVKWTASAALAVSLGAFAAVLVPFPFESVRTDNPPGPGTQASPPVERAGPPSAKPPSPSPSQPPVGQTFTLSSAPGG